MQNIEQIPVSRGRKATDHSNKRFGRLVALTYIAKSSTLIDGVKWKCVCDCGKFVTVTSNKLVKNKTRSCGCLRSDLMVERRAAKATIWPGYVKSGSTVIEKDPDRNTHWGSTLWVCKCRCGNIFKKYTQRITSTKDLNCGCAKKKSMIN